MERLLERSEVLVNRVQGEKHRYLYHTLPWHNRLIGIKGSRGTGKTTMMLQRLKALGLPTTQAAYLSLDDLYFSTHSLVDMAEAYYQRGGKYLFLDEVHKYPGWSQHIKNLYDYYPDLHLVFSGSSIIDISREQADLSRRAVIYELFGLSYREYLAFMDLAAFAPLDLETIVSPDREWRSLFPTEFRPLQHFQDYLQYGYYPFSMEDRPTFGTRMQQLIRTIVEYDMAELSDFDIRNAKKMLQLLYVLAANVPFKPNIKQLAEKSGIHRNTIVNYLRFLEEARLIGQLHAGGISTSSLQKPEKLYLNNTSLAYALSPSQPDRGNLRETFFHSQLRPSYGLTYPTKGDFLVNGRYTFEIGGKRKGGQQVSAVKDSFVVVDEVEHPVWQLPLWLFGFLY